MSKLNLWGIELVDVGQLKLWAVNVKEIYLGEELVFPYDTRTPVATLEYTIKKNANASTDYVLGWVGTSVGSGNTMDVEINRGDGTVTDHLLSSHGSASHIYADTTLDKTYTIRMRVFKSENLAQNATGAFNHIFKEIFSDKLDGRDHTFPQLDAVAFSAFVNGAVPEVLTDIGRNFSFGTSTTTYSGPTIFKLPVGHKIGDHFMDQFWYHTGDYIANGLIDRWDIADYASYFLYSWTPPKTSDMSNWLPTGTVKVGYGSFSGIFTAEYPQTCDLEFHIDGGTTGCYYFSRFCSYGNPNGYNTEIYINKAVWWFMEAFAGSYGDVHLEIDSMTLTASDFYQVYSNGKWDFTWHIVLSGMDPSHSSYPRFFRAFYDSTITWIDFDILIDNNATFPSQGNSDDFFAMFSWCSNLVRPPFDVTQQIVKDSWLFNMGYCYSWCTSLELGDLDLRDCSASYLTKYSNTFTNCKSVGNIKIGDSISWGHSLLFCTSTFSGVPIMGDIEVYYSNIGLENYTGNQNTVLSSTFSRAGKTSWINIKFIDTDGLGDVGGIDGTNLGSFFDSTFRYWGHVTFALDSDPIPYLNTLWVWKTYFDETFYFVWAIYNSAGILKLIDPANGLTATLDGTSNSSVLYQTFYSCTAWDPLDAMEILGDQGFDMTLGKAYMHTFHNSKLTNDNSILWWTPVIQYPNATPRTFLSSTGNLSVPSLPAGYR